MNKPINEAIEHLLEVRTEKANKNLEGEELKKALNWVIDDYKHWVKQLLEDKN